MTRITNLVLKLKVWKDTRGQDLIEYALDGGFRRGCRRRNYAGRGLQHQHYLQ